MNLMQLKKLFSSMFKKVLLTILVIPLAGHLFASQLKTLKLYIPPVGVGLLMVDAAQNPSLKKYAKSVKVIRWNTPDQLRAGMLDGSIDITFVPSYVGANFYNKGIKFKLMNIITGGILYVMSTDANIKSIEDLKGQTVLVPFQNDMPDLVLQSMLQKLGLKIGTDVKIKYVPTPTMAVKMAISGQAKTLLIPEVAATKVQLVAKQKQGITFHRSIDLTEEYGRLFSTTNFIPQAGVAVRETFADQNPELVSALHQALKESAKALMKDQKRVIKMTETVWKKQGKVFVKSLPYWNINVQSAVEVQTEIEEFYQIMHKLNPAIIGGKLPPDKFYMQL